MPWAPELFAAPALQRILDQRRRDALAAVPYFDGFLAGDPEPLVESFAGEPEVHDPVRGRVKGAAAFRAFAAETSAWLRDHHASVEDVEHAVLTRHGFEEVVLHLDGDGDGGPVHLPVAVVADRRDDGRIEELRVYFTQEPMGGQLSRPPLLQPDPALLVSGSLPDSVASYVRAFAAGDIGRIVAAFEPDGAVRDSGGGSHRGPAALAGFYESVLSRGGGVHLEACAVVDGGRACALEYDVVRSGTAPMPPQAGVGVFVTGESGRLGTVRHYDGIEATGDAP